MQLLLECVCLKRFKDVERFEMNMASKQARMSPSFSLTIMLSKIHNGALFCALYASLSCANAENILSNDFFFTI